MGHRIARVCTTLTLVLIPALSRSVVSAATFTVNSSADEIDVLPGDGICASRAGVCTLRAAVLEANNLAGNDSIALPAGHFLLIIKGPDEDAGATGDLDVTDDLVIAGAGVASSIIGGYGADRVFDVRAPAGLTLSDLTITGGTPPAEESGGGMLNAGTVTLTNVAFRANYAGRGIDGNGAAGDGGGLENLGTATLAHVLFSRNRAGNAGVGDEAGSGGGLRNLGTATLTDVRFNGNAAGVGDARPSTIHEGGGGGGMMNDGMATLTAVTFNNNRAGHGGFDGGGGWGGGLFNEGTVILSNVTFRVNRAGAGGSTSEGGGFGGWGGGFENFSGSATLTDVSFIQNRAGRAGHLGAGEGAGGGSGGGMDNWDSATLTNVTFDRNRAGDNIGDYGGYGGGLSNEGTATLTNVTITRNRGGNGIGRNSPAGDGGGFENDGDATLTNVTIALNRAGRGAFGGTAGTGDNLSGGVQLSNTIVFGPGESCSGAFVSLGHNLDSGATCGFAAPGDLTNTDPALGKLHKNGGLTKTMALSPGSPAIDAGDDAACPSLDQRGLPRPQGSACDIGAYEVQP